MTEKPARPPVILHVMHAWGGGLAHWVRNYIEADRRVRHLVLKPIGNWGSFGEGLLLSTGVDSPNALRYWKLDQPIKATDVEHAQYADAIAAIIREFNVDVLFVSSVIGHSLDVLRQPVKTCMVLHDYYPFCPALNISFNGLCETCDSNRLTECFRSNENNRFFINVGAEEWMALRAGFRVILASQRLTFITPTDSLRRHLCRMEPAYVGQDFHCIPHGIKRLPKLPAPESPHRLKILLPGSLAINKGQKILRQAMGGLLALADITLLGCGNEEARVFADYPELDIIPTYAPSELAELVQRISPDVAVMLSTVPETFSYTLSEMYAFGIPVITSRMGSFEDRVYHEETGLLVDPDADELLAAVKRLIDEPALLAAMRGRLADWQEIDYEQMVTAYHDLLDIPDWPHDVPPLDAPEPKSNPTRSIEPKGRTERLRGRIIGWHLAIQSTIVGSDRLSKKNRWRLLNAYLALSALPHKAFRNIFAGVKQMRR